jgi:hypothetical protein
VPRVLVGEPGWAVERAAADQGIDHGQVRQAPSVARGANVTLACVLLGSALPWTERLVWAGVHGAVNGGSKAALNQLPGVQLPGLVGSGWDAVDSARSVSDAKRRAAGE